MDTDIREALRRPVDPEIGVNIADLGDRVSHRGSAWAS
jgi:metal-sulfur cluster biosynthetic enzyme